MAADALSSRAGGLLSVIYVVSLFIHPLPHQRVILFFLLSFFLRPPLRVSSLLLRSPTWTLLLRIIIHPASSVFSYLAFFWGFASLSFCKSFFLFFQSFWYFSMRWLWRDRFSWDAVYEYRWTGNSREREISIDINSVPWLYRVSTSSSGLPAFVYEKSRVRLTIVAFEGFQDYFACINFQAWQKIEQRWTSEQNARRKKPAGFDINFLAD